MNYYKRSIQYILPYKGSLGIGIFFNILYAIFNIIAMLFFIPVLNILFDKETEKVASKPIYNGGISEIGTYLKDSFNFFIQQTQEQNGAEYVLMLMGIIFIM